MDEIEQQNEKLSDAERELDSIYNELESEEYQEESDELTQLLDKFKSPNNVVDLEIINAQALKTTITLLLSKEERPSANENENEPASDIIKNFLTFFVAYLERKKDNFDITISLVIGIQEFIPQLYKKDRVELLIEMLQIFITSEETLIRQDAMNLAEVLLEVLDGDDMEEHFMKLIYKLYDNEWWRCIAIDTMALSYYKLSDEHKAEVRAIFKTQLTDETPMAKSAMAKNYSKIIQYYDKSLIETDCVEMLDTITNDNQESVRIHSVSTCIALANLLDEDSIDKYVCPNIEKLVTDPSWKVRLEVADKIVLIQKAVKPKLARILLVSLLQCLCDDKEMKIRKCLASKIIDVLIEFKETSDIDLQQLFELINDLNKDTVDDVRNTLLAVVMDSTSVLSKEECSKYLLPLMKNTLMCQRVAGIQKIEEQCVYNVNKLIKVLGYNALQTDIETFMFEVLSSGSKWRTRRRLIVTLNILILNSDVKYFTEACLSFYKKILNDSCYAVRIIAPVILPVMIGKFGFEWGKENILNWIFSFHDHPTYFQRLIVLYAIKELVRPSIVEVKEKFINYKRLPLLSATDDKEYLYKVYSLNEILMFKLNQFEIDKNVEVQEQSPIDLIYYGEDVAKEFTEVDVQINVLELLEFIVRHVLPIFSNYFNDEVHNVYNRTLGAYKCIVDFHQQLTDEFQQEAFKDMFKEFSKERTQSIESNILLRLASTEGQMDTTIEHPTRGEKFDSNLKLRDNVLNRRNSLNFKYEYDDQNLNLEKEKLIDFEDRFDCLDSNKNLILNSECPPLDEEEVQNTDNLSTDKKEELSKSLINDADLGLFADEKGVLEFYNDTISDSIDL